jgi:Superinfection immunity protein
MDVVAGLLLLGVIVLVYFLPAVVASRRQVPNAGSVFVLNLFLGWTLIGWVVALAMACRTVPQAHLEELDARRNAELLDELDGRPKKTIRVAGRDLNDYS